MNSNIDTNLAMDAPSVMDKNYGGFMVRFESLELFFHSLPFFFDICNTNALKSPPIGGMSSK